ncbi:hypothetical protein LINGRAHAP2_LOCUS1621 [Linum grandiflorum]
MEVIQSLMDKAHIVKRHRRGCTVKQVLGEQTPILKQ